MHGNFSFMNTQHIRLACTTLLCLTCICVCIIQISIKNQATQQSQTSQLMNWQNQQINQYITHRILLSPHREPLGLSQWKSSEINSQTFCETIQNAMNLPNQWTLISSLKHDWDKRLSWNTWLNSLNENTEIIEALRSSYLKIRTLPNMSSSLCNLEISTKIAESNSLSTMIKFTSRKNIVSQK